MEKVAFSPTYTPPPTVVYLFTLPSYCHIVLVVNSSIEYQDSAHADSSTIRVCWVVTEIAIYCIMKCEYCTTMHIFICVVDEAVGSWSINSTTNTDCWVADSVLVPLKLSTALPAELWMKLLVPLKLSRVFPMVWCRNCTTIHAELLRWSCWFHWSSIAWCGRLDHTSLLLFKLMVPLILKQYVVWRLHHHLLSC